MLCGEEEGRWPAGWLHGRKLLLKPVGQCPTTVSLSDPSSRLARGRYSLNPLHGGERSVLAPHL